MQRLSKTKITLYSSLKTKKGRTKAGLCIAEGEKLVQEALASQWSIEKIIVEETWQGDLADLPAEQVFSVSRAEFSAISSQQQPEGILAIVPFPAQPAQFPFESLPESGGFLLWELRDPGNMGTILRTADWFGLPNVYLSPNCVELWNPKVMRASMGSIFRVNTVSLAQPMTWVEKFPERFWVADLAGTSAKDLRLPSDSIIVIGGESHGIPLEMTQIPGIQRIHIPRVGQGESLNAAMTATALAWQVRLQG